ncbi:glutaredoxin 3 [Apiospora arundinis]|jgi:glutaredoxin 3|uniref:Thioredoxin-like protein n=1 Tax=Apiospora arundinis TaxID=335852 RepID=A0ABR2IAB5_9PEZI
MSFLRRFFSSTVTAEAMSAATQKAQAIIDGNAVAVFSKSYCPYCTQTKKLLKDSNAEFYALELDNEEDGSAIQDALEKMTGQRTVPNVFIGQKHIGGNSDLQAKKKELKTLLSSVGALKA